MLIKLTKDLGITFKHVINQIVYKSNLSVLTI